MIAIGGNPSKGITIDDYTNAAAILGVEVATIRAISAVESSTRGPFDQIGRPTILFERHYFHKLTGGKYDSSNPTISQSSWGGYGLYSSQYGKLATAFALDPDAALKSVSWGAFQIMGKNHSSAGYGTVQDMVIAMLESEKNHLTAVTAFIKSNKAMLSALKDKNWAKFAKLYNGAGYAKNKYDEKLKAEYLKFSPKPPPIYIP